eukprot:741979-Rhodomonas_salina.1
MFGSFEGVFIAGSLAITTPPKPLVAGASTKLDMRVFLQVGCGTSQMHTNAKHWGISVDWVSSAFTNTIIWKASASYTLNVYPGEFEKPPKQCDWSTEAEDKKLQKTCRIVAKATTCGLWWTIPSVRPLTRMLTAGTTLFRRSAPASRPETGSAHILMEISRRKKISRYFALRLHYTVHPPPPRPSTFHAWLFHCGWACACACVSVLSDTAEQEKVPYFIESDTWWYPGTYITSQNGAFSATVLETCEFVVYETSYNTNFQREWLWKSNSRQPEGKRPCRGKLFGDGKLVLRDKDNKMVWQSGTGGNTADRIEMDVSDYHPSI